MSHNEKLRMFNLFYFFQKPKKIGRQLDCMTLVLSWRENNVCNPLQIREIQNSFKRV